jgi:hypothetical protein
MKAGRVVYRTEKFQIRRSLSGNWMVIPPATLNRWAVKVCWSFVDAIDALDRDLAGLRWRDGART